jgi:hypothetical protein
VANIQPIYLSMNDKPQAILRAMDDLMAQRDAYEARLKRRRGLPWLLFLAGLPWVGVDYLLGYNHLTCSLVTVGCWIAAIVVGVVQRRGRLGPALGPEFQAAREIIHTLRDDPDPRRNLFGTLDLSGPQQPSKLFREAKNRAGLAVNFYRDEWLSLKTKLYDGNMLRVSAVDRVKVRLGYHKRSRISGKQKWKAPKIANAHQLKVRLSVNPQVYEIAPGAAARPGTQIGSYRLSEVSTSGGIIDLSAITTADHVQASDVLGVLRLTYDMLKRKSEAQAA